MKHLLLFLLVIFECGFAMGALPAIVNDTVDGCMPPYNLHGMTTEEGALIEWSFINGEYDLPISHFNVYRSSTSAIHDFECIAQVPAQQGVSEYHYLDPIHGGLQFYRVRAFHEGEGLVCESIDAPRLSLEQYLPLDMNFEKGNWQFYDYWEYYGSLGYEVMELNWMDFFWGIKLTALRMQQYTDQYLTRFAIYDPEEGPGNYTIMIYKGGDNAPERCVMQQDFTLHGTNKWHYENLTDPVDVTPENTWVIITAHHVERPAALYEDHLGGLKNGRWISLDGQAWCDLNDILTGWNLNFMVRVRVSSLDGVEEEIVLDDAQIYPNPTTGVLQIEAQGLKGVEVYDLMGRQVVSQSLIQIDAKEIDLSCCPSGVYLVKLITDDGVVIRRVGVNK